MAINTAFFPKLMWNGRFSSLSGDPFDNSKGYLLPQPEGTTKFPPGDPDFYQLLVAQAYMPREFRSSPTPALDPRNPGGG
jgi:cytochrome c peroxidase